MRPASRAAVPLAALLAAASACSRDAQASPPPPASPPLAAAHGAADRPQLLFFMNPNGVPCQMQDRILGEIGSELGKKADVVRVRTTEPSEIALFDRYGIRALPSLVLTDGSGREIRRATPGIQPAAEVMRLVGP